ncbi:hypothetical protein KJA16_00655 [Patescibacteria group bacterium]|nr:hypothetical protein [Patescibacteria group bacterium]MBZ9578234.1 hypothetical protein [Patescibacteria group bacterium]
MYKIVYLFGAGATHAEVVNLRKDLSVKFLKENGLLINDVSKRVIKEAQGNSRYLKKIKMVSAAEGSLNIELLISLFEKNRIPDAEYKTDLLKKLVKDDILDKLTDYRLKRFYLHKALLELHSKIKDKEKLFGIISLNYDHILDEAYKTIFEHEPNYCFSLEECKNIPLLKLHGSFNWKNIIIYGRKKTVPIIPFGIDKNYLQLPYNFIWGRAMEILIDCDVLRIIGCSLNQNDVGLIDLLFKAHLAKGKPFEIQIIDFQKVGASIKGNYGFFPEIIKPKDLEDALIADESIHDPSKGGNPFKIWLRAKGMKMLKEEVIRKTKYLKKVFDL